MKTYKVTVDEEGIERWYLNDLLHREEDKPAIIFPNGDMGWYYKGELDRENSKPALIFANGNKAWFIRGDRVTEVEAFEYFQFIEYVKSK